MNQEVILPSFGENQHEVILIEWHIHSGDYVRVDELMAEVETEKITLEIRSPYEGIFTPLAQEGDQLQVGQAIGRIHFRENSLNIHN